MKKYAVKAQDGFIKIIQCKTSPEQFMEDTDTLLNEITDLNPLPNKKYRNKWADTAGDITLAQADMDTQDRSEKLQSIRDHRNPLLDEADKEIYKLEDAAGDSSLWRSYRSDLRNITDSYKDINGDPTDALDAVTDVAVDITWPTKP